MTRNFSDEKVADNDVQRLLTWAQRGPSAGNSQSLHLLVLDGASVGAYWDTTLPASRRDTFPWPGLLVAPVLIVPYVEPARYVDRYGEADKARTGLGDGVDAWSVPYWWVDGGAAVQTLLLGAEDLGLGACFFGQFDHEPAVRERFGVPDGFRAIGTVAIGHRNAAGDRRSLSAGRARRSEGEIVHWGQW
jgi:nitroreductase